MSSLEKGLLDICAKLEEMSVPYILIGGMANAIWGVPRATIDVDVAVGVTDPDIPVCTAEDLILFKICSDREKDWKDAEGIVKQNAKTIDRRYLDPRIETLSRGLDRPEILNEYLSWIKAD